MLPEGVVLYTPSCVHELSGVVPHNIHESKTVDVRFVSLLLEEGACGCRLASTASATQHNIGSASDLSEPSTALARTTPDIDSGWDQSANDEVCFAPRDLLDAAMYLTIRAAVQKHGVQRPAEEEPITTLPAPRYQ